MRVFELHAPLKVVQRSKGRSAVAAAAYRAGERIEDKRTGLLHDYTGKKGIQETALLLPENAPDYAHDRAELWNAAEQEKHPRAQTARDLTVSFPAEFNAAQRREAGLRIGEFLVSRYGAGVDLAWHEPSRNGDQRNHHLHALFTTRRWDANGEWAKTKDRVLDDLKRGPEEVKALRLGVADALNNIAARDRLDVYVEHVSFEQRGLDQESTQHLGPMATKMERQGIQTDIGNKNREVRARNAERERLRAESNVIDIEIAREQLQAKRQERVERSPAPGPSDAEAYAAFYRTARERRSVLLKTLDAQHGGRERELREQVARLTGAQDRAGFFAKVWRTVSGRAKAECQQLGMVGRELEEIQRRRQAAHEVLERERQAQLERLKTEQVARELERQRLLARPNAVGDGQTGRVVVDRQMRGAPNLPGSPANDYEERRRQFFRRAGAQRKAEVARGAMREAQPPTSSQPETDRSGGPSPAPPGGQSAMDYDARRKAFMQRMRREDQPDPEPDGSPKPDL